MSNNFINVIQETNSIVPITINGENIIPCVFFGDNRNPEFLEYNKKVFSFFQTPMNYFYAPFPAWSHGNAIDFFITNTIKMADYWVFFDSDSIPLFRDWPQWIYEKIRDKMTVLGSAQQSNHLKGPNGEFNHPYCGSAPHGISKELYLRLGKPSYATNGSRSDTLEEITYQAEERGFLTCMLWPTEVVGINDEEGKQFGVSKEHLKSNLGNGLKFGMGTTYSNLFFHAMCQAIPRSKDLFVDKCKKILGVNDTPSLESTIDDFLKSLNAPKTNWLSAVTCCVGYADLLEITLPKNKKHFEEFIIVTTPEDRETQLVCDKNSVRFVTTDLFYKDGAKFDKGAAISYAFENLNNKDWCVYLDADILLKDDFNESLKLKTLDKNLPYGLPRKFIWTQDELNLYNKGLVKDKDLTHILGGYFCGYFQLFNFKADKLKDIPLSKLYPSNGTGEQVDISFLYRFCPNINPNPEKLDTYVIHLGPPGINNNGKQNCRLDELKNKKFADLPDLRNDSIYEKCELIYPAKEILNKISDRDWVFNKVLSEIKVDGKYRQPLNILEIGTSRSIDGKEGDGWSTVFWANYIKEYGGKLDIVDINIDNLSVCRLILSNLNLLDTKHIKFYLDDGINLIDSSKMSPLAAFNKYDLIYLDGSDNPQESLDQFEKIDRNDTIVLIDDFHTKGKLINEKYKNEVKLLQVNAGHQMAIL